MIGVLEGFPQALLMNMYLIHWHIPFDSVALELIRDQEKFRKYFY